MQLKIYILLLLLQLILADGARQQDQYRQLIREKNRLKVDSHNDNVQKQFQMKLYDRFAKHTFEEIQHMLLNVEMKVGNRLMVAPKPESYSLMGSFKLGPSLNVNWTRENKVSDVTDQGYCGSCYAHVAVGDIQSSYRFRNVQVSLSIQQIVDCSWRFGNYGCYGGWMSQVFDYVKINGITTEEKYPTRNDTFFMGETGDCEQRKGEFRIRGYSYTSYKLYDCDSLTNMIQKRPVTVAVSVNWPFIFYHMGIFDSCDPISDIDINHAMLLVGVVENSGNSYWIVKNSWGVTWGELGYMRLDRYKDYGNQCQICLAPHYSII